MGKSIWTIMLILTITTQLKARTTEDCEQLQDPKAKEACISERKFEDGKKQYFYRLIGGYTGSIGRSAAPKGQYYFEVFASTPLDSGATRTWGSVKVASTPHQVDAPIQKFVAELATNIGNVKVNEIGHSGEFLIGLERRIPLSLVPFNFSPIIAVGATTPINPEENISMFQVDSDNSVLAQRFPATVGKQYVAFVPPQRDGAYWQYQAGVRLTTLQDRETATPEASVDLTLGQNQAITEGRFHGAVFRFEAMLHLNPKFKVPVYLFATGVMRLASAEFTDPLILAPAPSNVTAPAPNVAVVTFPPSRLDLTRFGIGVDLIGIFKKQN